MRAIKITLPKDRSQQALDLAFRHGASGAVVHNVDHFDESGTRSDKVVVDIETSTPNAKAITDAVIAADFFDRSSCSLSTRQPRAILSNEDLSKVTRPWVEPTVDICEELWQFCHVTAGFAGRVLIAGGLLAFGVIHQQLLLMIAGMLFLPLLPIMMGIGFGAWTREWGLAGRAAGAMGAALVLLVAAGVLIALVSTPPVKYNEFNSLAVSLAISFAVGVAAALANTDDGGRRELIGLAATAQIAVIPVWLGVCAVLGVPTTSGPSEVPLKVLTLFLNILVVTGASLITYVVLGAVGLSIPTARP
jgi:hypothetical protein